MVVHNGNTASGEAKTRGSLGLLVSPFSLIGKLQANERACLKEVDYVPDDNTQSCYLAYTYTHTHASKQLNFGNKAGDFSMSSKISDSTGFD